MSGGNELRYFEDAMARSDIRKLLDNKTGRSGDVEKVSGMKWLLADISKGHNASELYADVVKLVSSTHLELKKLVYIYLVHYGDFDQTCRDLNLMAINSYQKDLASKNQLVRSLALRALANIRVRDVAQIQLASLRQCTDDKSPYVRKITAIALPKVYELDQSLKPEVTELLEKLLCDTKPMVIGSAIMSVAEVCPENMEVLHKHYRKLCAALSDVEEWAQVVLLNLLLRYARANFAKPTSARRDPSLAAAAPDADAAPTVSSAAAASGRVGTMSSSASSSSASSPSAAAAAGRRGGGGGPRQQVSLNDFYGADSDDSDDGDSSDDGGTKKKKKTKKTKKKSKSKSKNGKNGKQDDTDEEPASLLDLSGGGSGGGSGAAAAADDSESAGNSAVASPANNNRGGRMDDDLKLLLQAAVKLMKSRNAGVRLAVTKVYVHLGTANPVVLGDLSDTMLAELRNHREIAFVTLRCVELLARRFPDRFAENYSEFFIVPTDNTETQAVKLSVLSRIARETTAPRIVAELLTYLRGLDSGLVRRAVRCLVRMATRLPAICPGCVHGLLCLVGSRNGEIVTAAVTAVQQLFVNVAAPTPDMVHQLMDVFVDISQPQARSCIVWIAAQFGHLVADDAPDFLRLCVLGFVSEPREVKLQILYLAARLNVAPEPALAALRAGDYAASQLRLMLQYVADLCAADQDHDVRTRAALVRHALGLDGGAAGAGAGVPLHADAASVGLLWQSDAARRAAREAAAALEAAEDAADEPFLMGSLSHTMGHAVLGYLPLPPFQDEATPAELRDKATYEAKAAAAAAAALAGDDSDSDSGSGSGSGSGSDSSSGGSSSSSSGSGSGSSNSSDSSDSDSDDDAPAPAPAPADADLLFGTAGPAASPAPAPKSQPDLFAAVFGDSSSGAAGAVGGAQPAPAPAPAEAADHDGDGSSSSSSNSGSGSGSDSDSDSDSDSSSGSGSGSGSNNEGEGSAAEPAAAAQSAGAVPEGGAPASGGEVDAIADAFGALDFS